MLQGPPQHRFCLKPMEHDGSITPSTPGSQSSAIISVKSTAGMGLPKRARRKGSKIGIGRVALAAQQKCQSPPRPPPPPPVPAVRIEPDYLVGTSNTSSCHEFLLIWLSMVLKMLIPAFSAFVKLTSAFVKLISAFVKLMQRLLLQRQWYCALGLNIISCVIRGSSKHN